MPFGSTSSSADQPLKEKAIEKTVFIFKNSSRRKISVPSHCCRKNPVHCRLTDMKALVPSVTPDMDPNEFAEITKEEIQDVIRLFQNAAKRLKRAGFDMIMLHGGHGNLTSAFFSPLTNQRTDEYGGSLEKRMTFGLQMAKALREAVGDKMAIEFRISQDEFLPGSPTWDEQAAYINALSEYIDLVNISNGLIWHPYYVRYMMPS